MSYLHFVILMCFPTYQCAILTSLAVNKILTVNQNTSNLANTEFLQKIQTPSTLIFIHMPNNTLIYKKMGK